MSYSEDLKLFAEKHTYEVLNVDGSCSDIICVVEWYKFKIRRHGDEKMNIRRDRWNIYCKKGIKEKERQSRNNKNFISGIIKVFLSFPIFQTAITWNPIQQSIQPVLVVVIALFLKGNLLCLSVFWQGHAQWHNLIHKK